VIFNIILKVKKLSEIKEPLIVVTGSLSVYNSLVGRPVSVSTSCAWSHSASSFDAILESLLVNTDCYVKFIKFHKSNSN
jgi:hypothetical protein